MLQKELLRQFRATSWAGPAEVENFIFQAGQLPPDDVVALLGVMTDKRASSEGKQHALRRMVFGKLVANSVSKELFVPFVRALRNSEPHFRAQLLELIPVVNNVLQHAELVALFWDHDPTVRRTAAEAMSKVRGPHGLRDADRSLRAG